MTAPSFPIQPTDFTAARAQLKPYIRRTPLIRSDWLSALTGAKVYLKLENLQATRSFKARGALYKLLRLAEAGATGEVLAVSAGNHGQALAWAAKLRGFSATVIVPETAPQTKIEAIRRRGANLIIEGRDYDEAELLARRRADATGITFVSPYNDLEIICGQGTVAGEIIEELPELDMLLVPVGGGGLLAGAGLATRYLRPSIRVVGVQAENSCAMYQALAAGRIVPISDEPTIADGLAGNVEADSCTFPLIQATVEQILLVSEEEIKRAIVATLKQEGVVLEGAGAATVAALMAGKLALQEQTIGVILSGSNIDFDKLSGLVTDPKLVTTEK